MTADNGSERKASLQLMVFFLAGLIFSGCGGGFKEVVRGVAGNSTKVLKDTREAAAAKDFSCGYDDCLEKARKILSDMKTYVYAVEDGLVAVYVSEDDTTPVGVFFSSDDAGTTKIEVSSPSGSARDRISRKLFAGMDAKLKSKKIEVQLDAIEGKK